MASSEQSLWRGAALMVIFALAVAVMAPVVQKAVHVHSPITLYFLLSCVRLLPVGYALLWDKGFHRVKDVKYWGLHWFYALTYSGQLIFYFASLKTITIFEGVVLFHCWPLLVPLLALMVFREKAFWEVYYGAGIGFLGVVLITWKPGVAFSFNEGFVFVLLSALCAAFTALTNQALTKRGQEAKSVVYGNMTLCFVVAFGLLLLTGKCDELQSWEVGHIWSWAFVLIGFVTYYLTRLLTKAYQYAAPARIAPVSYISLIFSACLQWLLFGAPPSPLSALGAFCVAMGAVVVLRVK